MDELVINLDQFQKLSKASIIFNTLLGSAVIIISGFTVFNRIIEGESIRDYFIHVIIVLAGVNMILYTYGILFRIKRRYVVVNDRAIDYKLSYFYPARTIRWEDIDKVEIKTLRIYFHSGKGPVSRMKLGEIFYNDIKDLKQHLSEYCRIKGIQCTDTTVESQMNQGSDS